MRALILSFSLHPHNASLSLKKSLDVIVTHAPHCNDMFDDTLNSILDATFRLKGVRMWIGDFNVSRAEAHSNPSGPAMRRWSMLLSAVSALGLSLAPWVEGLRSRKPIGAQTGLPSLIDHCFVQPDWDPVEYSWFLPPADHAWLTQKKSINAESGAEEGSQMEMC